MQDSFGGDASTSHLPKKVVTRGNITHKITDIPNIAKSGNEVSQNRRYRNHEKVNNETHGGRVMPDAYSIYEETKLTDETKNFCKKYGIPVMVIHKEKYKENTQTLQPKESEIPENESER